MEQRKEETPATSPKAPRLRNRLQKCVSRQQSNSCQQGSPRALEVVTFVPRDLPDDDPAFLTQPRAAPSPPRSNRQPTSCTTQKGHPYPYRRPLDSPELLKPESYFPPATPDFPQPSPDPDSMFPTNPRTGATPRSSNTLHRTSSVELIAEQYNAVIEHRYFSEEYSDDSDPALSPHASDTGELAMPRRRRGWDYLRNRTPTDDSACMTELPGPSPVSDDGTLVSFQGEAVYFKPLSTSPEPETGPEPEPEPQTETEAEAEWEAEWEPASVPLSRQTTAGDNVGLQISLELLTHELSSAMAGRPCRSSRGTSALQVWAMIEAYERLWEQMSERSQSDPQAKAVQDMFDMWLRALYAIHSKMSKDAREEYASGG